MIRLPDTYYTKDVMGASTVSQDGVKSSSPIFYQGEDVVIYFYLNYNGQVPDENIHILEVFIKKSDNASNILWKGVSNSGLYKVSPGYYYIIMPASASSLFLPGIYYMDVQLTEKPGRGDLVKDLTSTVLSTTFSLELNAASPNPKLKQSTTVETSYDPETQITTFTTTSTEPTVPDTGTDISLH